MNDLLTVEEVAKMLRVDSTTIRRWMRAGALPAIVLPKRGKREVLRIRRADIEAILQS